MPWKDLSLDEIEPAPDPTYRVPKQERGTAKFEKLLDAAHGLIVERGIDGFSLTDMAERADVATGSAYHFFPSVDAALVALAGRYDDVFTEIVGKVGSKDSWHDVLDAQIEASRQYMNEHRPVLTLLIGAERTSEMRQVNAIGDSNIAKAMVASLQRHYVLPSSPPPEQLMHMGIALVNGIWELSVLLHGHITDEYARETTLAVYAYLRRYWPEHLEKRPT